MLILLFFYKLRYLKQNNIELFIYLFALLAAIHIGNRIKLWL